MKNMEEWRVLKKNAHETYNGGHNEKETNDAFHHGMDTGFNVAEKFISLTLAQRDEEIKRAIYLLKNIVLVRVNDEPYLRVKREEETNLKNAIDILSHLQETEGKV